MPTEKNSTVFSNSLNRTFSWFCKTFEADLKTAVQEFWEYEVQARLISVFDTSENIFKGEEFFVTKVFPQKNNKENTIFVKLSKELCGLLLEKTLGKNESHLFSFESITELETKILMEFNTTVGRKISITSTNKKNEKIYNLVFYIKISEQKTGKMIICIPDSILEPQETQITEFDFKLRNFAKTLTTVSVFVGKSKISLLELKQLDKDDIVVLEKSKLSRMTLYINGESTEIKVNPDPSLIINTEENEVDSMGETLSQDMWDTIQVEIGAEFDRIKISLGELKQISEGLVVDIGSVYENKISLKVEKKLIATGELVIINDRYGIRIDEVYKQDDEEVVEKNKASKELSKQDESDEISEEDNESDDSDYSDFDVDDEDL